MSLLTGACAPCRAEQQARFREAGDAQFIALLHTMDNPNIPLEHKWSGIQRHMGEKQEFGCGCFSLPPVEASRHALSCHCLHWQCHPAYLHSGVVHTLLHPPTAVLSPSKVVNSVSYLLTVHRLPQEAPVGAVHAGRRVVKGGAGPCRELISHLEERAYAPSHCARGGP